MNFLAGSRLYRLLGRILDGLVDGAKKSALYRLLCALVARLRLYSGSSRVVRRCTRIADGFGRALRESALVARFLKEDTAGRFRERGLFFRLYQAVLGALRKLYHALRLNRLLEGSIFLKPWLWGMLAMAALPLLPTMAALGLVLVSILSLVAVMLHQRERELRYFALNKYVWLYALVYGLATLASVTPGASLKVGLVTICFILFYQVLVSGIASRRQIEVLIGLLAGMGALVSLYGLYQFLNQSAFTQDWLDDSMFSFFRVYSTFGNPNVLGEYFLLVIPLGFGGLLTARTRPGRLYFLGCSLLMCLCMVLTYSRGCYLGILFAAALFLVLLDRRFIVPGLIVAVILVLAMPSSIIQRFLSIGNMGDSSTSYRVYIWQGVIAMLRDYWFSGVGPGEAAFNAVYPVYAYGSIIAPHSHNLFLQITSDAGVGGLLLFLCILFQYFKAGFAALRRKVTGRQRILVIACLSSVVGFLVQSMTDYTFYNYRVMLLFWGVLAVGTLVSGYDTRKEAALL